MQTKFKIGQVYFYILWGEIKEERLIEICLNEEGLNYSFEGIPYVITEDRIFFSREEAENYIVENEKRFLQEQIEQVEAEIKNCDFNIDLYQKKKITEQKELKKLQKKLDNCS